MADQPEKKRRKLTVKSGGSTTKGDKNNVSK
jgi:hypothetical protein